MTTIRNIPGPQVCNLDALLENLLGAGEPLNDRVRCKHCLRPLPWDWVQDECAACQSITCERCKQPCIEDFARPADVWLMPNGNHRCAVCIKYDGTICEDCDEPFGSEGFVTLRPREDPHVVCYACFRNRVNERKLGWLGFAQRESPEIAGTTPGLDSYPLVERTIT